MAAGDGNGGYAHFSRGSHTKTFHPRCRIFIIEGLLTVAISFVAYFLVPTWSYKAKFVSPRYSPDDTTYRSKSIAYRFGTRTFAGTTESRLGRGRQREIRVVLCSPGMDGSSLLGLRTAVPRLCVCLVLSQPFPGQPPHHLRLWWS